MDNLRRSGFNNTVASLRPVRTGGSGPAWQRQSITLYERPNYRGRGWTFADDEADLARYQLGDQVSSVRVSGGRWNLCFDANFQRCREIRADVPNLRQIGMNNTISSIQELSARPGMPGPGPGPGPGVPDGQGFSGQCATASGDVPSLSRYGLNDRVSSLRRVRR